VANAIAKRPRILREVEALARVHTERALNVIIEIMNDADAGKQVRLNAATEVLNRGWGKARQAIIDEGSVRKMSDAEIDAEVNRRIKAATGISIIDHDDV
jgi:HEAT repeat protein